MIRMLRAAGPWTVLATVILFLSTAAAGAQAGTGATSAATMQTEPTQQSQDDGFDPGWFGLLGLLGLFGLRRPRNEAPRYDTTPGRTSTTTR
jgi:MYXO-CTERM domain-containing protein